MNLFTKHKLTHIHIHTAAAAKSLQSCLTLCSPIDGSLPGSPVPGILKARTLEWVAISFSNAWKWKVKGKSFSCVQLFATPWTAAYHAPPFMGFSRQEYWSGLPLPSPIHTSIRGKLETPGLLDTFFCCANYFKFNHLLLFCCCFHYSSWWISKKQIAEIYVKQCLMLFCRSFIVSCLAFKSLIHFELTFVYGVRECPNFIFLLVAIQLSQHHLLKRLHFLCHISLPPLS